MHPVFGNQVFMNIIEYAVYKLATEGCAVFFGKVNIFIDGYFRRNGLEKQELANAHLHENHIQGGNPVRIPVLQFRADQCHGHFSLLQYRSKQVQSE